MLEKLGKDLRSLEDCTMASDKVQGKADFTGPPRKHTPSPQAVHVLGPAIPCIAE